MADPQEVRDRVVFDTTMAAIDRLPMVRLDSLIPLDKVVVVAPTLDVPHKTILMHPDVARRIWAADPWRARAWGIPELESEAQPGGGAFPE